MFGIFNEFYDMNHDGELSGFEKSAELPTMACILDEPEDRDKDVFGEAGLDYNDLEMMDSEERYILLEETGLDPLEFDF